MVLPTRWFSLLALVLACSSCSMAGDRCGPRAPAVTVPTLPPAPLPEVTTAPPAPGMTLVAGYWHWDRLRWVWVPGHWVTPPPGQRWAPARTVAEDGRVVFHAGQMTCAGEDED